MSVKIYGPLGEAALGIAYEGYEEYPCLVPVNARQVHVKHLMTFRPDLFTDEGIPKVVGEDYFFQSGRAGGVSWYKSKTHEPVKIIEGWELNTELKFQFTSIRRGCHGHRFPYEKLLMAVADNEWVFAKSMPQNPHEYCLRRNWNDATIPFDEFVLTIRKYGFTNRYGNSLYRCMQIGDYYYWSMGAPLAITILLNRKKGELSGGNGV